MSRTWVSFLILAGFLAIQAARGHLPLAGSCLAPAPESFIPVSCTEDQGIQPPRRTVRVAPASAGRHTPLFQMCLIRRGGTRVARAPLPPRIALVLGQKMDWEAVTADDLRQIPGISHVMAQRLIRLRDTMDFCRIENLLAFPHVGRKTVERLKRYCAISHES